MLQESLPSLLQRGNGTGTKCQTLLSVHLKLPKFQGKEGTTFLNF